MARKCPRDSRHKVCLELYLHTQREVRLATGGGAATTTYVRILKGSDKLPSYFIGSTRAEPNATAESRADGHKKKIIDDGIQPGSQASLPPSGPLSLGFFIVCIQHDLDFGFERVISPFIDFKR